MKRLYHQLLHHASMHVGQAKVAALEAVREPGVVETQPVQDRGVQVVNVTRSMRALKPSSSLVPKVMPGFTPPPANHMLKQFG